MTPDRKSTPIFRRLTVKDETKLQKALDVVQQKGLSCDDVLLLLDTFAHQEEAIALEAFNKLYSGDTSGYPSRTEADLAFCEMLVRMYGENVEFIDDFFRHSGLMREKWDRKESEKESESTYGKKLIEKAISNVRALTK